MAGPFDFFNFGGGVPSGYNQIADQGAVALDPNKPVEGFQLAAPWDPEGGYINPQTKEFISSKEYQTRQGINRYGIKENQFNPITNAEGNLQDKYKLNLQGLDPAQWQGYQKLKGEALRTGPSAWAQLQGQKQGAEELAAKEGAARQAAAANMQARQQLSMGGGLNSGARGRLAAQSQRDLLAQRQQVGREGMMARLGISQSDETNRLAGLKDLAGSEQNISQFNVGTQNQTQQVNLQNLLAEMQNKRQFEADKYKQNMAADQANRSAEVTARQGGGGGNTCCFIFLEARYGNGTMDKVVRKYRDEHMTVKNIRGYHKVSEVLVPLMRKSKIVKFLVRALLTDPMVSYGKWHYKQNKHGWIFKPVAKFWIKTFEYLGGEHEYIRENGEVV